MKGEFTFSNKESNQQIYEECRNFRKKISQAAYVGFYPVLNQDPKDFKAGTNVEG